MVKKILFFWFALFCFPGTNDQSSMNLFVFPLNNNSGTLIAAASGYMGACQVRWCCFNLEKDTPFSVFVNFPNPCNPQTTIRFDILTPSNIRLDIFNLRGAQIKTLPYIPSVIFFTCSCLIPSYFFLAYSV